MFGISRSEYQPLIVTAIPDKEPMKSFRHGVRQEKRGCVIKMVDAFFLEVPKE